MVVTSPRINEIKTIMRYMCLCACVCRNQKSKSGKPQKRQGKHEMYLGKTSYFGFCPGKPIVVTDDIWAKL